MEFNEKLQELRKRRGFTQEELAERLYVSRAAVSKWESGRGYPAIESLKAIAKLFSVTIDELLSGDELITAAEEDSRRKEDHIRDLVYGLLDMNCAMLFFLPFFAQRGQVRVQEVTLAELDAGLPYMTVLYMAVVIAMVVTGILTLVFHETGCLSWKRCGRKISMALSAGGTLLFIAGLQPYAAAFVFILLIVKAMMLIRWT